MKIIGITGGSGSGKTTIVNNIAEAYGRQNAGVISLDYYYHDNAHIPLNERESINFDHPDALEFNLLIQHIHDLKAGKTIDIPQYSFITCTRLQEVLRMPPPKVLIVEGILTFNNSTLLSLLDLKIFINLPKAARLERIIERDTRERGRSRHEVIERFHSVVNKMHDEFVQPAAQFADYIFDAKNLRKDTPKIVNTIIHDKRCRIT